MPNAVTCMRVADTLARLARAAWWAEDCVDYARLKAMIVARSRSESEREGAFFTGVLQEVQKVHCARARTSARARQPGGAHSLMGLRARRARTCVGQRILSSR